VRRLALFDIDGTLLATGGPAKGAFRVAMMETFGTVGDIEIVSFAGKTDPQIARELLRGAGLEDATIDEGLPDLWRSYLRHLEMALVERPMRTLPGVVELLAEVGRRPAEISLGLLTGNIQPGAVLKLRSVGLDAYFATGSFGSDSEVREDLAAIAMRRARETWGVTFASRDVYVIGDTPRDVACGRQEGTRTLAVASGHFGVHELEAAGADHVLEDLSDTERVLELLTE